MKSPVSLDVMKSVGLTEKDLEQQYQYTKEIVNDGGVQKGVTWQATPGLFAYRRSIARQVPFPIICHLHGCRETKL